MKAKKLAAILMSAAMTVSVCACGSAKETTTEAESTPAAEAEVETTAEETSTEAGEAASDEVVASTGDVSIDFEDGNMGFIALDTAPGDASEAVVEIVDFNGSKALKVTAEDGKIPYVAIDTASLAGEDITKIRSMEVSIGLENPDGTFYAASGNIYAYSGEARTKSADPWSVYLETKNPNTAVATLDNEGEYFVKDAQNFFIITKETDNGLTAGKKPAIMYIDNIKFLDEAGNVIKVDTAAGFDKPAGFGAADLSNLLPMLGEAPIEGATGSSDGGWGQAVKLETTLTEAGTLDATIFEPGCIVTVYYSAETAPELVFQSWEEGAPAEMGWGKVATNTVNDSNTICQYTYDEIVAAIGTEDIATYLDCFYVGDTGSALSVSKVTVAKPGGEEVELEGATGSTEGGWAQAVELKTTLQDGGTLDATIFSEGCTISVYYESAAAPAIIFQSWEEGAPEGMGWGQVMATTDDGSVATFSWDDIMTTLGISSAEDIAKYTDTFWVGDTGEPLKVTKVTVQ